MDRSTHPLTAEQLAELRGLVAPSAAIFRAVLFLLAGLLTAKLFHVLQVLLGADGDSWWWLVPTAVVMAALYRRARRWTGGAALRRRVRRDIRGGVVAALRVAAASAVEIQEAEDEGPGFLVWTSTGEAILFAGQYLDLPEHEGFPWQEFEILEAPASAVFFGLRRLGDPLAVEDRRPPLSQRQARDLGILDRAYVILDARGRSLLEGRRAGGEPGAVSLADKNLEEETR